MSQFQPPQFQQLPPQFGSSKKNLAIYMFVTSWVAGVLGAIFLASILGFCIGVPLVIVALVTHILGFVFLAQIREC
jgi:hypothetical protein